MLLYKKEWSDFNFLVIDLVTPTISVNTIRYDAFGDEMISGLDAPTKLLYTKEKDICWRFDITLLGFGVNIFRQYTY